MHNDKTHRLIPGGAHTYSKGDDQFPSNAPRYLERGEGVYVWSDHGHRYLDWTMGLRTVSLGYGIASVNEAAMAQIGKGTNFGRPSYIETQYAEDLLAHLGYADMAKFGKNGSNVTTAAVKIARAYTGRDYVALGGSDTFYSFDDWYIGTTPITRGIPRAISELSLPFAYGKIAELEQLFDRYPKQIACVILEAATWGHPPTGYLGQVRDLCHRNGALFILDEMITGFRWHAKGAQAYYGVEADLSTFGKGIANGFAVAALVGKRQYMEIGGLSHDGERVFLLSATHGAENHALAAARAALKIYREEDPTRQMWKIGQMVLDGINGAAKDAGIEGYVVAAGVPCSPWISCKNADRETSMGFRTLFLQEMTSRNVLINYLAPSWSHTEAHVEETLAAAREAFKVYSHALESGLDRYLKSEVVKPVFRKFN